MSVFAFVEQNKGEFVGVRAELLGAADVLLLGATVQGRDLSAWVSAELDAGVVPDVIELAVDGDRVVGTHPVYAGKLQSKAFVKSGKQIVKR